MPNGLFSRHLASQACVHRDMRRHATHFVGIAMIVFSLLLVLGLCHFTIIGRVVSALLAVAILAGLGWPALDAGVGLVMTNVMVIAWNAAERLAGALKPSGSWVASAAHFAGGWIVQLLGHYYEGKRPAVMDHIFQSFIGPMFLVAEVMVETGYRPDLANVIGQDRVMRHVTGR